MSRRSVNPVPLQLANRALKSASEITGTSGVSSLGGLMLPMGDDGISPSSASHLNSCCAARYRLFAVDAERVSSKWTIHASMCSRRMEGTLVGMPAARRNLASWEPADR